MHRQKKFMRITGVSKFVSCCEKWKYLPLCDSFKNKIKVSYALSYTVYENWEGNSIFKYLFTLRILCEGDSISVLHFTFLCWIFFANEFPVTKKELIFRFETSKSMENYILFESSFPILSFSFHFNKNKTFGRKLSLSHSPQLKSFLSTFRTHDFCHGFRNKHKCTAYTCS